MQASPLMSLDSKPVQSEHRRAEFIEKEMKRMSRVNQFLPSKLLLDTLVFHHIAKHIQGKQCSELEKMKTDLKATQHS